MPEEVLTKPVFIFVIGVITVLAMLVKAGLEKNGLPALVGYLLLGLGVRWCDDVWGVLNSSGEWSLELLGELGVICILFRVGLESDPRKLAKQLPRAVSIWIGNVVLSAGLGYVAARFFLGFELIPSLFVATALSATSVGVSVLIWDTAGRLKSETGEQLIDVAELDDLSAIIFMVALFAAAPLLHAGTDGDALSHAVMSAGGIILAKGLLFGGLCYVFVRFFERRITGLLSRFESTPDPMISLLGIGFIIAAFAGWLGFSVAIGALFAGLTFSRDPEAVKMEPSFLFVYDWLSPFFFIAVGLRFDLTVVSSAMGVGGVLLVAAVLGKLIGAGIPAWLQSGTAAGALLGVSMIPRAEIALVIVQKGSELGEWAVPKTLYGAMVVVSAFTCLGTPAVLRKLFDKWPKKSD